MVDEETRRVYIALIYQETRSPTENYYFLKIKKHKIKVILKIMRNVCILTLLKYPRVAVQFIVIAYAELCDLRHLRFHTIISRYVS